MRKRKLLLIVATLLILLMIGGFFFARSVCLLNKIRVALEDGLEKQLNHSVTIEQISGNALRQLDIEHFEIADKQPGQPSLIALDKFKVKYDLLGLVRRKFIIADLVCRSVRPCKNPRGDSKAYFHCTGLSDGSLKNRNFRLRGES